MIAESSYGEERDMKADELREMQAPFKACYREEPQEAMITLHAEGDIDGFGDIAYAGHDIDEALQGAELIYVVGPAYSTEPFGAAVAGKLQPGQTVVVSPSSCGGALAFKRAAGLAVEDDAVRVAETSTLHMRYG